MKLEFQLKSHNQLKNKPPHRMLFYMLYKMYRANIAKCGEELGLREAINKRSNTITFELAFHNYKFRQAVSWNLDIHDTSYKICHPYILIREPHNPCQVIIYAEGTSYAD